MLWIVLYFRFVDVFGVVVLSYVVFLLFVVDYRIVCVGNSSRFPVIEMFYVVYSKLGIFSFYLRCTYYPYYAMPNRFFLPCLLSFAISQYSKRADKTIFRATEYGARIAADEMTFCSIFVSRTPRNIVFHCKFRRSSAFGMV